MSTKAIIGGILIATDIVAVSALKASVRPKSQYVLLKTLLLLAILAAGSIAAAVEKTGLSLMIACPEGKYVTR
jgi:hypothetical protein